MGRGGLAEGSSLSLSEDGGFERPQAGKFLLLQAISLLCLLKCAPMSSLSP